MMTSGAFLVSRPICLYEKNDGNSQKEWCSFAYYEKKLPKTDYSSLYQLKKEF